MEPHHPGSGGQRLYLLLAELLRAAKVLLLAGAEGLARRGDKGGGKLLAERAAILQGLLLKRARVLPRPRLLDHPSARARGPADLARLHVQPRLLPAGAAALLEGLGRSEAHGGARRPREDRLCIRLALLRHEASRGHDGLLLVGLSSRVTLASIHNTLEESLTLANRVDPRPSAGISPRSVCWSTEHRCEW